MLYVLCSLLLLRRFFFFAEFLVLIYLFAVQSQKLNLDFAIDDSLQFIW